MRPNLFRHGILIDSGINGKKGWKRERKEKIEGLVWNDCEKLSNRPQIGK